MSGEILYKNKSCTEDVQCCEDTVGVNCAIYIRFIIVITVIIIRFFFSLICVTSPCVVEYLSVVSDSLAVSSPSCLTNIQQAVSDIEKMITTDDGRQKLKAMFK